MEELNEDCGCGSTTDNIRSFNTSSTPSKYNPDPLVGKKVNLTDGRRGLVDDSIRNSTGEVIGYVIEGDMGKYRVFSNKIKGIDESGEALATLPAVPGMGSPKPPMPDGTPGSGDRWDSVGMTQGKKKKKDKDKKQPNTFSSSLMDFKSFIRNTKKNQ
jgi:hypothetical protein